MQLQQCGDDALKPFGYDLFEGDPSTIAPVTDIQVLINYAVGPGDWSASYVLRVGRDGSINFPKLGSIMVAGLSFEGARASIEQHVQQQLIPEFPIARFY